MKIPPTIPTYLSNSLWYLKKCEPNSTSVIKIRSLTITPEARENPALKPLSMLVLIMAKKTGPVKKDEISPAPIPKMIASNMFTFVISANMRFSALKPQFLFSFYNW
ncbi:hypothetical protein D3C85_1382370 [compost metagenome]